jgi:cell division protease FtsH
MVMRFGMGRGLGARVFGSDTTQPFLGRALSRPSDYSQQTARDIDVEIARLVADAYEIATQILKPRQAQLRVMAGVLLERETLGRAEFEALLACRPVTGDGRVLRFRPRGSRRNEAAEAI